MPQNFLKNKDIAIIAYAETKLVRKSDMAGPDYAGQLLDAMLQQTGIDHAEIDGLACNLGSSMRFWPNYLAENLGIQSRWTQCTDIGGASAVANVNRAALAIHGGQCSMALCVATPPYDAASHSQRASWLEFEHTVGYQGPAAGFALLQRAYDLKYGLKLEALGRLAVAQRNGAVANDNAVETLRKPISVEDYLNSRIIADPIRLLDCVMPCRGAYGVLVTSTNKAKELGIKKMVHPVAYSEMVNFNPKQSLPEVTETGFSVVGPEVLAKAGMSAEDIDMFHPYDDFLIAVLMQLEQIGFCERGEGSRFLMETDISPRGKLPINTGGGQISAGQPSYCGSGLNMGEALRQLFGEAGERQIPNARTAMSTGIGIIRHFNNWGTSNAMIFERAA